MRCGTLPFNQVRVQGATSKVGNADEGVAASTVQPDFLGNCALCGGGDLGWFAHGGAELAWCACDGGVRFTSGVEIPAPGRGDRYERVRNICGLSSQVEARRESGRDRGDLERNPQEA